jgi:hypothetical protein
LYGRLEETLSKGGRLILKEKVLLAICRHFISLFPILVGVATRLEKLHRDFMWGELHDEFKFHLVKWLKFFASIKSGGLGVKNIIQFN